MKVKSVSISEWLEKADDFLEKRQVPETRANAEFLLAEVLGVGRSQMVLSGDRELSWKQGSHFWEMVKARGKRLPLAYVIGYQPFCGLDVKVTPSVLVPRPETEGLVEEAVKVAESKYPLSANLHILDVGTGSGCIALALAKKLSKAMLYATDLSDSALKLAEENAVKLGLIQRIRFLREDLFKPSAGGAPWADIVVSNPPYIPTGEIDNLSPEVHQEPFMALDGGESGMEAIKAIAADAPRVLKPGGYLLMEFMMGQGVEVKRQLDHLGFSEIRLEKDLQGVERIVVARR
ncbi:MAG: protein-(glutamine-N5) methyltransferase, release factor-specific [Elusimicrobia bacterium]|nr:MAG: protein-(glutamine-N5) methyltransferase, release factor-specific [Elusimicrobiota bacterium]